MIPTLQAWALRDRRKGAQPQAVWEKLLTQTAQLPRTVDSFKIQISEESSASGSAAALDS